MENYEKIFSAGLQQETVEHNTEKGHSTSQILFLVTKLGLKRLELEKQEMKWSIFALYADLSESKKTLEDNHTLLNAGDQLYKLKSINKQLLSLSVDRFSDKS